MDKEEILKEYDLNKKNYTQFSHSIEALIKQLLSVSGIVSHSVTSRVKERDSLQNKIEKKDKYKKLGDITDIVGIRIITHYSDEVDQVASIIENEFSVDKKNSIDKRATIDPDRFGYLSLHYVVNLSQKRSKLIEYSNFNELKFEIQIRSILQHTWAEIEHDIGYKSKIETPKHVRRKFSQLAGLLELADDQFIQIRKELDNYEIDIQESIVKSPESLNIDKITIFNYINTSGLLKEIDNEIAKILGIKLKEISKENAARHLKYLDYFGIETISDLEQKTKLYRKFIIKRAKDIGTPSTLEVSSGISIFYLYQVLASMIGSEQDILKFLNDMGLSFEPDDFAKYLYEFGKQIV